jgi:hypothetical protein
MSWFITASRTIATMVIGASLIAGTEADAATIVVAATGTVANTEYSSFTFNGQDFQTGRLTLDVGSELPFELKDGDTVEFTISLDGTFAVPGSSLQFFGVNFEGVEDQQAAGAANSGTILFANAKGLPANPVTGGCGNCLSIIYGADNAGPFSFDGLSGSTLISLSAPYTINRVSISYQLSEPSAAVPEPASWALMITGFALAGATVRRRSANVHLA